MCFWAAIGAMSSLTLLTSSARLMVVIGFLDASGSSRAIVRSCCTRRVARLMPSLRREKHFCCASGVFALWASCTWSFSAVRGVRNSCAASEANRCWAERLSARRRRRSLMAFTRLASSAGSPLVESGSSEVGDRRATDRAVFSSGARPLPTTIQTAMAMKGKSRQSG